MKNIWKWILYLLPYLLLVTLAILLLRECRREPVIKEIRITDWIPVPVLEYEYDTIYEPSPIKVVLDSTYYDMYVKLKDSISKDSMVRDALTIREYNNKFEDSVQTIDVYSKVRGHMLSNTASYVTKPFKIRYDTIIEYETYPRKTVIAIGGNIIVPLTTDDMQFSIYPEIDLRVKNKTYSGGYDFVNDRLLLGGKIDLW